VNRMSPWILWVVIPAVVFVGGVWVGSDLKVTPTATAQAGVATPGASVASTQSRATVAELSEAFEAAAAAVEPAVVPIFAEQTVQLTSAFGSPGDPFGGFFNGDDFFRRFFGSPGQEQKQTVHSLGSGVIVDKDGYILTNNHVVQGAQKLTVVLEDKTKHAATIVGTDPQTDVAVIKIDGQDLPTVRMGDSDRLKVGQWVIAVGNPFQLMHSVTQGIVSARGRSEMGLADYEDFIQTDASINPGNSGGALADLDGNLVGINTAISSPTGGNVGIGFAIPINMARRVMDQLVSKGRVTRGYLGLIPQDLNEDLAKALNLPGTEGALVGDVTAEGPADRAGVQRGDVITQFDGQSVANGTALRNMVAQAAPGSSVRITVLRDGREHVLTVSLDERPKDLASSSRQEEEPAGQPDQKLGLSVQPLTSDIAAQLGYENEHGLIVSEVAPGSVAADAGLRRGDLIKEVDRTTVRDVQAFRRAIERLHQGDSVALLVRRGVNTFFVGITIP
jgi:serine protease Do